MVEKARMLHLVSEQGFWHRLAKYTLLVHYIFMDTTSTPLENLGITTIVIDRVELEVYL